MVGSGITGLVTVSRGTNPLQMGRSKSSMMNVWGYLCGTNDDNRLLLTFIVSRRTFSSLCRYLPIQQFYLDHLWFSKIRNINLGYEDITLVPLISLGLGKRASSHLPGRTWSEKILIASTFSSWSLCEKKFNSYNVDKQEFRVNIRYLNSVAKDNDRAIVHRMVEDRTSEHKRINLAVIIRYIYWH